MRQSESRHSIPRLLADVYLAQRQGAKGLSVWPLLRTGRFMAGAQTPVTTLSQALEDGFVSVDEIPRGRGMSDIHLHNRASDAVLVVHSEELPGGRGTLLVDVSVLIPPSRGLLVAAHSTSAWLALDALRGSFQCVEGQIGFAAAIDDEIVGVELMADPGLFARSFSSLLRPYLADALSVDRGGVSPMALDPLFNAPEEFLEALADARVTRRAGPTRGWGRPLRIAGGRISGCALEAGELIHLSAFPLEVAWAA